MSRPHIEFIQQQSIQWTLKTIAVGLPRVHCKILSQDSDSGGFTSLVQLEKGWQIQSTVIFDTAQEYFVLDGNLQVGVQPNKHILKPGCYLYIPANAEFGPMRVRNSCKLLWMADAALEPAAANVTSSNGPVYADTSLMEWETPWVKGPLPGLRIKLLWQDEETGAYSRLIRAEPEWTETRQEHHECIEEVYLLKGDMKMGRLGTMKEGGYIWRPPMIKHGPMYTQKGATMFIRTDGPLVNFYTTADGT